jgi:hypothetical protein
MATRHRCVSRLSTGAGCTRSRPKPGRRLNCLSRASQLSRALVDLWLQRSASLSPPTSTAIRTRSIDVLAAWFQCATEAYCWDGREEDAAHKMVRAPCGWIRNTGRAGRDPKEASATVLVRRARAQHECVKAEHSATIKFPLAYGIEAYLRSPELQKPILSAQRHIEGRIRPYRARKCGSVTVFSCCARRNAVSRE